MRKKRQVTKAESKKQKSKNHKQKEIKKMNKHRTNVVALSILLMPSLSKERSITASSVNGFTMAIE
jgi:hypothetical protein